MGVHHKMIKLNITKENLLKIIPLALSIIAISISGFSAYTSYVTEKPLQKPFLAIDQIEIKPSDLNELNDTEFYYDLILHFRNYGKYTSQGVIMNISFVTYNENAHHSIYGKSENICFLDNIHPDQTFKLNIPIVFSKLIYFFLNDTFLEEYYKIIWDGEKFIIPYHDKSTYLKLRVNYEYSCFKPYYEKQYDYITFKYKIGDKDIRRFFYITV